MMPHQNVRRSRSASVSVAVGLCWNGERSAFRHGCIWSGKSSQDRAKQGAPSRRAESERPKPFCSSLASSLAASALQ